jgi:hypothetical protein
MVKEGSQVKKREGGGKKVNALIEG